MEYASNIVKRLVGEATRPKEGGVPSPRGANPNMTFPRAKVPAKPTGELTLVAAQEHGYQVDLEELNKALKHYGCKAIEVDTGGDEFVFVVGPTMMTPEQANQELADCTQGGDSGD